MAKTIELKLADFLPFGICECFKIIFEFMSQPMLPWQWIKVRGQNDFLKNFYFLNADFRNGINRY